MQHAQTRIWQITSKMHNGEVKCYCGCLNNGAGHKNNRDCFFNDDGTFDLMGLNCGLCIKTALISKQMLAEGKSVQEISDYVDSRWQKE